MTIRTIPSFPFELGDTFRAKVTPKGRPEEVELLGFEPGMTESTEIEGELILRVLIRTTKRKRAKRMSTRFHLSENGNWYCDVWIKD